MVHLRIVVPKSGAEAVVATLLANRSVCNVARLEGASIQPVGDVILADVAPEDASLVIGDLKALGVQREGAISVQSVESMVSDAAAAAVAHAPGSPADAVVWEEVEARTADSAELSWSQVIFMAMAGIIAACGILLDSAILIVGAMVVSPDFGPVAGFCVGVVNRRFGLARRSLGALAVGLPVAITVAFVFTVIGRASGLMPEEFTEASHNLANIISSPDVYSVIVAASAGVVGVMSLTSAKSGALVGVLISVTTIPAAANIGVACAYGDWSSWRGSQLQLIVNIVSMLVAGVLTLLAQRSVYARRRRRHLAENPPVRPSSPETTTPRASS